MNKPEPEIPAPLVVLVAQIVALAVEITSAGRYHAFAEWAGHVRTLSVRAHQQDADYTPGAHRERFADMTCWIRDNDAERQLKNIITLMESLR